MFMFFKDVLCIHQMSLGQFIHVSAVNALAHFIAAGFSRFFPLSVFTRGGKNQWLVFYGFLWFMVFIQKVKK